MKIKVSLDREDIKKLVEEKEGKAGFKIKDFDISWPDCEDVAITYERVHNPKKYDYLD